MNSDAHAGESAGVRVTRSRSDRAERTRSLRVRSVVSLRTTWNAIFPSALRITACFCRECHVYPEGIVYLCAEHAAQMRIFHVSRGGEIECIFG